MDVYAEDGILPLQHLRRTCLSRDLLAVKLLSSEAVWLPAPLKVEGEIFQLAVFITRGVLAQERDET